MILSKEKKGNITIYHVDKVIPENKLEKLKNTFVKPSQITLIINDDADVYSKEGELLLKFRKNQLTKQNIDTFYENIISFALNTTTNRGSTTGSKHKNVRNNPKTMTNIIGFYDKLSPIQKFLMTKQHKKIPCQIRETRFNMDYPEKYKKLLPLINEIDKHYKKLIPKSYEMQIKKANQTPFRIGNTSFTTITTNVNFQTTMHTDTGDDKDGFGNLTVIENGKYDGGETCFPQYGIGVNVRSGDILFMDVHQLHGNLPIKKIDPDAKRLSIVCYLRIKIWEKTKGVTKKFMIKHNKTIKNLRKK